MTRERAIAFIDEFLRLRGLLSDDLALQVPNIYPEWRAGVHYQTGQKILHNEVLYKVLQDHRSMEDWSPVNAPSLFAKVLIPDEDVIPEWVQPDSTNPYMAGDKVTYAGKTYESIVDNNVWSPDTYGWKEI